MPPQCACWTRLSPRAPFPAAPLGCWRAARLCSQGARGRFTYDEAAPAVTPETVYDVASLTKVAATTAAAMLLHQRGLLRLETPLGELLPGFAGEARRG